MRTQHTKTYGMQGVQGQALNVFMNKLESFYTSNLTEHLKALEQKEANTPKRSKQQEIIKLRDKINN